MTDLRVAFVGTGPDPDNRVPGESFAQAYRHAPAYRRLDGCDLVACADIVRENAEAFAEEFAIPDANVYEDYEAMLAAADPDVVSVCTPVPTHAPIVLGCLRSGVPRAIHCEKPMALTWGESRLMAQEAWRRDVQLTFNHQNRFASPWRPAMDLLDAGEIGDLERVELSCGELLDNGTHFIDLANAYADESPAKWVLGAVDYRREHVKYGAHNENQGLALWEYENGVDGLASTGYGSGAVGDAMRLRGTEGEMALNPAYREGPACRIRRGGGGWETVEVGDEGDAVERAIEHVVDCLRAGEEPELSARRALATTEIIFAAYESARRRARVELPLDVSDNPLESMVEAGELSPAPAEET